MTFARLSPAVARLVVATVLVVIGLPRVAVADAGASRAPFPRAPIGNDEGGAEVITGEFAYTSSLVVTHFVEPVVSLMNVSPYARGDFSNWVPRESQILGTLTGPLSPSPTTFRVEVPRRPPGTSVDLDNDGEVDLGVRLYAVQIGPNLAGDSFLEQYEQVGFNSYLEDPLTGRIREGSLLVYAPDDRQGFPGSAGADGRFFTADDPVVALPAGYTLVILGRDGSVRFERSRDARMDVLEPVSEGSPDLSDQGILESFDSLIDLLKVRYSYTALRGIDWEDVRGAWRPQVEAADAASDLTAYYMILNDLALSVRDGHVFVLAGDIAMRGEPARRLGERFGATVGAGGARLSDGRYIITYVDPDGPAADVGWGFGTEIVSVDGAPVDDYIDALPLLESRGNPETIALAKMALALAYPTGTRTTIGYRQPGEELVRTATFTAGDGYRVVPPREESFEEISFEELDGGYGYIHWGMFNDPPYKIAVWEKFLATFHGAPGLVIDLRNNGGGNGELMFTMASYLFPADDPAKVHWLDFWTYDEEAGDLVKEHTGDFPLFSPKAELTYAGAVAVLVDDGSASAAEYMPQFLQVHDRAIVVGEHGTDGAGGMVENVALPGRISFYFTKGRTYFAGTDELNLEGKGVTLDVRVPITEDNERAKLEGRDPVLEAAMVALGDEAARRASSAIVGRTWEMTGYVEAAGSRKDVDEPERYTLSFAEDGALAIRADCNRATASYELGAGGVVTISPGPATMAVCPGESVGEDFVRWLGAAETIQYDGVELGIFSDPSSGVIGLVFRASEE